MHDFDGLVRQSVDFVDTYRSMIRCLSTKRLQTAFTSEGLTIQMYHLDVETAFGLARVVDDVDFTSLKSSIAGSWVEGLPLEHR